MRDLAETIRERWLDPDDEPESEPRARHQCGSCGARCHRVHSVVDPVTDPGEELVTMLVCDGCLPRPVEGQFPKRCGCGRGKWNSHRDWCGLPLAGYQDCEAEVFEMRHCGCGSTLAVEVDVKRTAAETARERMMYR